VEKSELKIGSKKELIFSSDHYTKTII
jgi:hypothetical protein